MPLSAGDIGGTDQHGYLKQPNACEQLNKYILEWTEDEIKIIVNDKVSLRYPKQDKNWANGHLTKGSTCFLTLQ